MNERFVIITSDGDGYSKDTNFHLVQLERDVLDFVADANTRCGLDESREVVRIFKLTASGQVTHCAIEIEGFKFKLKMIPGEGKR